MMKLACEICGNRIKTFENAYFFFSLPGKSMTEIQAFLKENAKVYCAKCVSIKKSDSFEKFLE